MVDKSREFKITPRAKADLINIGRYTEKQWGSDQRVRYLQALHDCFNWLAQNQRSGKLRDEIDSGYMSFPNGSHVIFYVVKENYIAIIGILHKTMDVDSYF